MSFYRLLLTTLVSLTLATSVLADQSKQGPSVQSQQVSQPSGTPSKMAPLVKGEKVNINTANVKELIKVKGLSRAKAKNIMAYRKKHGDFKSLDDLKLVKGFKKIKDADLRAIQDQLMIS